MSQLSPIPDPAAPMRALADWPAPGQLAGERLLLVEDDDDTRMLLAAFLESLGARVCACASGGEALERAADFAPTLVVSDIGMPEMDGYGFMRSLRELERARGSDPAPALALTAYGSDEDRARALDSGFQMHLAKPVPPPELASMVQALRAGGNASD